MSTAGRHLLVEYSGCDETILNDLEMIRQLMLQAAERAGTIAVGSMFKPFKPQGVTGVVVIEESHLSIHTWPEHKYAAVDFFTCGGGEPQLAHQVLLRGLGAQRAEQLLVERGLPAERNLVIRSHIVESLTSGLHS